MRGATGEEIEPVVCLRLLLSITIYTSTCYNDRALQKKILRQKDFVSKFARNFR
jgi:hypothetical protein